MTQPVPFDLAVGPAGLARLTIHPVDCAGVDLTPHVRSLGLRWADGEVPVLAVELHADASDLEAHDEGEGPWRALTDCAAIVKVPVGGVTDPGALVDEWLAAIDPGELERGMLERTGWGGPTTTGELALAQLRALATGRAGPPESLSHPEPGG